MPNLRRVEVIVYAAIGAYPGRPGVSVPWLSNRIDASQPVEFPVDVMPAAFLANTVFYGAVLAAPWVVWGVARRIRRRRRRLCVACGYDVKGLGRCPECGRAIQRSAAAEVGA